MTEQQLVPLIVQIPLVFAFMWFALRLSSDYRADAEKRDKQWQTFIDQQNELWRSFIKDLVERSLSADDIVSQRLAELATVIRSLLGDFKTHDQKTGTGRHSG